MTSYWDRYTPEERAARVEALRAARATRGAKEAAEKAAREEQLDRLIGEPNMVPLTGDLDFMIDDVPLERGVLRLRIPKWPGGVWNGMPVPAGAYATPQDLDAMRREWLRTGRRKSFTQLQFYLLSRQFGDHQGYKAEAPFGYLPARHPTPPPGMAAAVYRPVDADERLLYVGLTSNTERRKKMHARASRWTPFVHKTTFQWYATREEGSRAEIEAIRRERPLFNRQYNASAEAAQRLVEYLTAKERLDLLPAWARRYRRLEAA